MSPVEAHAWWGMFGVLLIVFGAGWGKSGYRGRGSSDGKNPPTGGTSVKPPPTP